MSRDVHHPFVRLRVEVEQSSGVPTDGAILRRLHVHVGDTVPLEEVRDPLCGGLEVLLALVVTVRCGLPCEVTCLDVDHLGEIVVVDAVVDGDVPLECTSEDRYTARIRLITEIVLQHPVSMSLVLLDDLEDRIGVTFVLTERHDLLGVVWDAE